MKKKLGKNSQFLHFETPSLDYKFCWMVTKTSFELGTNLILWFFSKYALKWTTKSKKNRFWAFKRHFMKKLHKIKFDFMRGLFSETFSKRAFERLKIEIFIFRHFMGILWNKKIKIKFVPNSKLGKICNQLQESQNVRGQQGSFSTFNLFLVPNGLRINLRHWKGGPPWGSSSPPPRLNRHILMWQNHVKAKILCVTAKIMCVAEKSGIWGGKNLLVEKFFENFFKFSGIFNGENTLFTFGFFGMLFFKLEERVV